MLCLYLLDVIPPPPPTIHQANGNFHSPAGKDRTVQTPHEAIVHDYVLTRVGAEPARNVLLAAEDVDPDSPGMRNLCSTPHAAMVAFIKVVKEKYGGARGYFIKNLGFSGEGVDVVTENLIAEA